MGRITLADLNAPEVELPGGHVYTILPATRAITTKATAYYERIEQLTDGDVEAIVELYCELLDIRLQAAEKGQQRASTVAKGLWSANRITVPQLLRLIEDIGSSDRPT